MTIRDLINALTRIRAKHGPNVPIYIKLPVRGLVDQVVLIPAVASVYAWEEETVFGPLRVSTPEAIVYFEPETE